MRKDLAENVLPALPGLFVLVVIVMLVLLPNAREHALYPALHDLHLLLGV